MIQNVHWKVNRWSGDVTSYVCRHTCNSLRFSLTGTPNRGLIGSDPDNDMTSESNYMGPIGANYVYYCYYRVVEFTLSWKIWNISDTNVVINGCIVPYWGSAGPTDWTGFPGAKIFYIPAGKSKRITYTMKPWDFRIPGEMDDNYDDFWGSCLSTPFADPPIVSSGGNQQNLWMIMAGEKSLAGAGQAIKFVAEMDLYVKMEYSCRLDMQSSSGPFGKYDWIQAAYDKLGQQLERRKECDADQIAQEFAAKANVAKEQARRLIPQSMSPMSSPRRQ